MNTRWLDADEQRAWRSLMTMTAELSAYLERQLRAHSDLSTADYEVLAHLSESPDGQLRAKALGAALRWDKSRLSQHLTRMERRGLTTRLPVPDDQRGCIFGITDEGRARIATAAPLHTADVRDAFIDHASPTQLATLCELGDQIKGRLSEIGRDPAGEPGD